MNGLAGELIAVELHDVFGIHEDGWCGPLASFKVRAERDTAILRLIVWLKPEVGVSTSRFVVTMSNVSSFACEVPHDTHINMQVACDLRAGESAQVTIECDNTVADKGNDHRDLSYQLDSMAFL